jgi:ABC-type spermidine/putrescine transport system permease subunit II
MEEWVMVQADLKTCARSLRMAAAQLGARRHTSVNGTNKDS